MYDIIYEILTCFCSDLKTDQCDPQYNRRVNNESVIFQEMVSNPEATKLTWSYPKSHWSTGAIMEPLSRSMFRLTFSIYSGSLTTWESPGARTPQCVSSFRWSWSPPGSRGGAAGGTGAPRTVCPDPGTVPQRLPARLVPAGVPHGVRGEGRPTAMHGVRRTAALAAPRPH